MSRNRRSKPAPPMPGWASYLRTSDKDAQNPKLSQERQRSAIERNLFGRSDLPIYETYVDNLSGRSADKRNDYQRMLDDARAGKFSFVAAENAERFGRNDAEALSIIDELHAFGVSVRFADYPDLDPIDPDDRILVSLSFTLARRESIKIGQRCRGGMYAKLRSGGFIGKAPDGYVNREEKTTQFEILNYGKYRRWIERDPEQSLVWREAWDMLLEDTYPLKEICEVLHAKGYRFRTGRPLVKISPKGKRTAAVNGLSRIFHNWVYAGWVVSEKADILPKTIRGEWEAIVTTEEFERGLAILDRRNQKRSRHRKHHYLLRAMLYLRREDGSEIALTCSKPNASRKSGGTPYYCIPSSRTNLPCAVVEDSLAAEIARIQVDPALVPQIRDHYTRDLEERLGYSRPEERRKLEAALEDIKQEESRAARLYAAGRISDDIWEELWQDWCDRRTKLITSLDSLERTKETHISNLDAALDIISKMGVRYGQLDAPQQRQLLQEVVERVIVNADGEVIDLELLPPFGYLQHVKEKVETAQQGEMKSDAHEGVACSDSVSLGDPIGIRTRV